MGTIMTYMFLSENSVITYINKPDRKSRDKKMRHNE